MYPMEEQVKALAIAAAATKMQQDAAVADPQKGWANGTQEFAEKYRHFKQATPWFHTLWYDAFDDPTLSHLYVQAPREHAKRLDVSTPIPTPSGWTTMGQLAAGDVIFDDQGNPCRVVKAHPIMYGDAYKVTFDDGSSIIADAEHLWLTWDKKARASAHKRGWPYDHGSHTVIQPKVRTTNEIRDTIRSGRDHNHSIPITLPLDLPAVEVPLDPYLLGCWLGDGDSSGGVLTLGDIEIVERLRQEGAVLTQQKGRPGIAQRYRVGGLHRTLRTTGLLNNKHVPAAYLRGSIAQRSALLAGLMDTDGTAHKTDGTVAFCNTRETLVQSVYELAVSLGFKPRIYAERARLYGRDCGPMWRVFWSPRAPVFRLTRKQAIVDARPQRGWRTQHRFVVSVEAVPAVSMRCITVDSSSSLYLAGPQMVPTHNSSCTLTYALRRLCEDHHVRLGIISGTDGLAMKFLNELKHEFESNQALIDTYGGPFQGAKWTDHELVLRDAYDGPNGISGKDVSVFSVGRGAQISSRHCDILIADDVESADSVRTENVRQSTREWWAREVTPVLSPGGKFICVGTRKSHVDLYSRLIADPTWVVLDKAKAVWDENGEPIWPEMWSKTALLARKTELDAQDVMAWSQEMLNAPRPSDTQMFWPEKWPTYQKAPHGLTILQFWDLAISEKTNADFTVGWTIGTDEDNNVFLLEMRRGRWNFNETLAEIGDMGRTWPTVTTVGIEQVAYQAAAVQEALRRTMLPIVPSPVDKDKVTRARLVEARAAAGKVIRPVVSAWWTVASEELSFFPAGSHDDIVDALAGAVRMAGWGADAVGYAYGVWTCANPDCRHMFMWEAGRACPKCGRKSPTTFENPDIVSYGGLLEDQPRGI